LTSPDVRDVPVPRGGAGDILGNGTDERSGSQENIMNRGRVWRMGAALLGVAVWVTSAAAQDNAVVKGKVVFKGDAEKYKRTELDTSKDPNCKKLNPKGVGSYEVILNKKTNPITVRNVMVSVKEGLGDKKFPAKTEPVILDQKGCEYTPHVIPLMEGQALKIRNSDDTNHNIHLLPKMNQETNFSQPKQGMEQDVKLVKEEVFKAKCDVHPWMGCYIRVFDHPFFAVTGEEGTFEIKGLPPGKYTIEAWHETFGTQTMSVDLKSGETKEQDFTYEPK
jgi:plastocyanin